MSTTFTVPPYVFEQVGTFTAPYTYTIPGSLEIRPDTASATFDGTGAGGNFLACLTFYSPEGSLLCRMFNPTAVAAGDIAEVTFIPPFGSAATSAPAIGPVNVATITYTGGNKLVTGTTLATATTMITSGSFVADGVSTYQINVWFGVVDCGQGAHTGQQALQAAVFRGSQSLGLVFDFNPTPADYGSIPFWASIYDVPPSGTTTYSLKAFTTVTGGSAGNAHFFAATVGAPNFDQVSPGYIAIYNAG